MMLYVKFTKYIYISWFFLVSYELRRSERLSFVKTTTSSATSKEWSSTSTRPVNRCGGRKWMRILLMVKMRTKSLLALITIRRRTSLLPLLLWGEMSRCSETTSVSTKSRVGMSLVRGSSTEPRTSPMWSVHYIQLIKLNDEEPWIFQWILQIVLDCPMVRPQFTQDKV